METTGTPATAFGPRARLQAARQERGWSQTDAARRLAELATRRDSGTTRPGSLKTQLSRWENGHAVPSPEYRALLAELYGCAPAELGLDPAAPPEPDGGAERLRAAIDRSAALDDAVLDLLCDELRTTAALDHRLGTAGAHAVLAAQVERLGDLLDHSTDPGATTRLAGLLAGAALLAGDQERDRAAPDLAWRAYVTAGTAALRADRGDLAELARERRCRLRDELDDAGRAGGPPRYPADVSFAPPTPLEIELGHDEPSVRTRTEQALREVIGAHRAGRTEDAASAAARARPLALRAGSARTVSLLDGLVP